MKLFVYWPRKRPKITYILLFCAIVHAAICQSLTGPANPAAIPSTTRLLIPASHVALSGDVQVQVIGRNLPKDLYLEVSRQISGDENIYTPQTIEQITVITDDTSNVTTLTVRCGVFAHGGPYFFALRTRNDSLGQLYRLTKELDVRWPQPKLTITPEHVQTYPQEPVTSILEFPDVICQPTGDQVAVAIPEFWLELHFCGPSLVACEMKNSSSQVLYSQQIRGFPGRQVILLRCELFGLAGHYALFLRPTSRGVSVNAAVYLKAEWSEEFVFNVHARSIFPCDSLGGGVPVLFQYPACILQSGDRIRLYAKLRADVASLVPPTSLEYISEQKISRGQHSLHFDCDLFVERYVEYCFVYVSQAITGAVADVRMDCVPTLPVSDADSGGWGEWSPWTPCTTTCAGGTRNRYRFCDSPPPRYGAKFCEGPAVETQKCGTGDGSDDWECLYGSGNSVSGEVPADRPEVVAEIGPGCRCGCVIHLGKAKPRRLVATSSQSCPGRTFWLIQADQDFVIRFKIDHFRLPCGSQWLKVRDGNSLSSRLVSHLEGMPNNVPGPVQSSGPFLLLEFFSDELMAGGEVCGGGFLAHAQQIYLIENVSHAVPVIQGSSILLQAASNMPATVLKLTLVHIVSLLFIVIVFVVSAALIVQYMLRYRKYQVAEDMDSFISLSESTPNMAIATRTGSNSTLLSEVISMTRLRSKTNGKTRHIRLRESKDCEAALEDVNDDSDTINDDDIATIGSTMTLQTETALQVDNTSDVLTVKDSCSIKTLTPKSSPLRRSNTYTTPTPEPTIPEEPLKCKSASPREDARIGDVKQMEKVGDGGRRKRRLPFVANLKTTPGDSNTTITSGCCSPALSTISTSSTPSSSTNHSSTNPKDSKNKRNRARLLLNNPGSEQSLSGPDNDFELDYYDYNVVNSTAAPGSYLGMDPAYLVWIPPLDENCSHHETIDLNEIKSTDIDRELSAMASKVGRKKVLASTVKVSTCDLSGNKTESNPSTPSHDRNRVRCQTRGFLTKAERETVEKSPSDGSVDDDEIRFADDDVDEDDAGSVSEKFEKEERGYCKEKGNGDGVAMGVGVLR